METVIRLVLSNYFLTFLVLGLLAAGISVWRRPRPLTAAVVVEDLFRWFLFFSIGVAFAYSFVAHGFFGDTAARFIGWEPSPFQFEVGMASLGFSVLGFLAFRGGFGQRVAAVVGSGCFLLGAAAGHIREMIVAHNFEPGNAGVIFYLDIGIPLLGVVYLWLQHRLGQRLPGAGVPDVDRAVFPAGGQLAAPARSP
jgi:hypothetical protein